MHNLLLLDSFYYDTKSSECVGLAFDNLNEIIYTVSDHSLVGFSSKSNQTLHFVSLEEYFTNAESRVICLHFLPDQEELSIITSSGDCLIWKEAMETIELVGSIESGITCAEWSPDNELLVITTGGGTYLVMSFDFDPVCEQSIQSEEFGEGKQVNLGWGKKETQFHGSQGKDAAKKQIIQESSINKWDDSGTEISWRGDGQLFAITAVFDDKSSEVSFKKGAFSAEEAAELLIRSDNFDFDAVYLSHSGSELEPEVPSETDVQIISENEGVAEENVEQPLLPMLAALQYDNIDWKHSYIK